MAFFNSKLRYALCAAVDLAMQPGLDACQSREIAARQDIPGAYLDQIMATLKGAGIVRSIRGAGGGYNLARAPERITVGDIVKAIMRGDKLFSGVTDDVLPDPDAPNVAWVVRDFEEQIEQLITSRLEATTLAELSSRKTKLDDALSYMQGL